MNQPLPRPVAHGLIRFTRADNKTTCYIRATDIRTIEKDPGNILLTVISTYVMTPQGFLGFPAIESQDEIVRQYYSAFGEEPPILPTQQLLTRK